MIGGDFTSYNGTTRNHVARLNADGSLDTTFDPSNILSGPVYSLAMPPSAVFNITVSANGRHSNENDQASGENLGKVTAGMLTVTIISSPCPMKCASFMATPMRWPATAF